MGYVWIPEKKVYRFCGYEHPRYYCLKCEHVHFFSSKIGKKHIEYGKYPDFPFLPGRILINIPKGTKLTSIEGDN